MKTQVLSVEQMQHLQKLGVDTSKASCYWWYAEGKNYLYWGKCFDVNGIPTFNLQDMLEMMPESITSDNTLYHFELLKLGSSYSIGYKGIVDVINNEDNSVYNKIEYHILLWDKNLLTCAYETLYWLTENNYIGGEK